MLAAFTARWYRDVKPCLVQFSSGLKQFSTRTLRLIRETGDGFVLNSQYWTAVHTFAALVKHKKRFTSAARTCERALSQRDSDEDRVLLFRIYAHWRNEIVEIVETISSRPTVLCRHRLVCIARSNLDSNLNTAYAVWYWCCRTVRGAGSI